MSKISMNVVNGIWVTSTTTYGVEVIATADHLHLALRGLKEAMHYVQFNLYKAVIRMEGV